MSRRWSRVILRSPRLVLLLTSLIALVSLLVAAARMEIRPSRAELVFTGERLAQLQRAFKREFPDRDGVVVVVEATNLPRAKQFVSAVAVRLHEDPEHIAEVFYRVDAAPFETHSLQYLSLDELEELREKIESHRELIQDITTAPGLNTLFAGVNRQMGEALVGHFFTGFLDEEEPGEVDLGFLNTVLRQMRDWLDGARSFASPWGEWLGTGKEPVAEGYLLTEGKGYLVLLVTTRQTGGPSLVPRQGSIERVREAIAQLREEYPGVEVGVTGSDALASDEMVTARRDATEATIVAIVGVTTLFILFWKNVLTPLRALLSLAVGVCWTLGFIALTVGSLNILSAMFLPILIGLGIDYNVHLLERFAEERAAGHDPGEALETTFRKAGVTTATGAITTVVAFYSLLLTDFKGLVELGFVTGSGLLLCLGAAFTVLPALLVVQERQAEAWTVTRSTNFLSVFEQLSRHPRAVLAGAALMVAISLPALARIQLEFNLLELQAHGTESVDWEMRLLDEGGTSTWFGIVLARSPEEVKAKTARIEALPSVDQVQSIFSFLPEKPAEKLAAIQTLQAPLGKLPANFGRLKPVNIEALRTTLERVRFKLGDTGRFSSTTNEDLEETRALVDAVKARLAAHHPAETGDLLAYQAALFGDFERKMSLLRANLQSRPMTLAQVPQELTDRFIGTEGTYLLKVYPRGNIWGREGVQEFVSEVRSVDPDAIGDPISAWEHGTSMERGYLRGGLYAAIAMAVVIFWSFGSLTQLFLAVLPLAVGGAWTLGLMDLFDINFNLANLIILPLIVGYGIMNGLHIVKRYQQQGKKGPVIAHSTGRAVFLSATTTMVGFGSLMVASHRGIFSLGFLLSVGVGSILLASLTVLPVLLWSFYGMKPAEAVCEPPQAIRYSKESWQPPKKGE